MTRAKAVLVAIATLLELTGCGGGLVGPTPPPSTAGQFAIFMDRETGFTTSDVRDAQDQIVRFSAAGELIWTPTTARFPGYIADGAVITADRQCAGCYFLVRFGTVNGQPHAYLTWAGDDSPENPATVLDLEVTDTQLTVSKTSMLVPRT